MLGVPEVKCTQERAYMGHVNLGVWSGVCGEGSFRGLRCSFPTLKNFVPLHRTPFFFLRSLTTHVLLAHLPHVQGVHIHHSSGMLLWLGHAVSAIPTVGKYDTGSQTFVSLNITLLSHLNSGTAF
jgi:hypothetical protein